MFGCAMGASRETTAVAELRSWLCAAALAALAPALGAAAQISGEVYAIGAQVLRTPQSQNGQVVLQNYVPDGTRVRKGDVVLSIDGAAAASSIRSQQSLLLQARARADKELADLEVKAIDAERALRNAELAVTKAELDAGIPKHFLPAFDFDRYQGELTRTRRELEVKQREWADAKAAIARRREDARLEQGQIEGQILYWQTQLDAAEVRATRDGIVVHGFDPFRGNRYDEGSQSFSGNRVGEIVDGDEQPQLGVRAWVLEVDRPALQPGQALTVSFDAVAGSALPGRIAQIAGAPSAKAEWGEGRYFEIEVDLELDAAARALLRPGASARLLPAAARGGAAGAAPSAPANRRLEGEIIARDAIAISPPRIEEIWMLSLTQLLPDGSQVNAGDVVATFEPGELQRKLSEKRSALNEKQTLLQKLVLEHAERARAEVIATAEQRAKVDKARRKAAQPADLVAAIEYRKLVAERQLAETELVLVESRERMAARQREAERAQIEAEAADLKAEVEEIGSGLAKLQVKAPRAGVMLHLTNHQGQKFDVGAQVFRGQAVAQIPDLTRLAVRMQVPERLISQVRPGQATRIEVDGGAAPTLFGKVGQIGRVVRSRSGVKPVPVVDVEIEFDAIPDGARLKPGLPVRVELAGGNST